MVTRVQVPLPSDSSLGTYHPPPTVLGSPGVCIVSWLLPPPRASEALKLSPGVTRKDQPLMAIRSEGPGVWGVGQRIEDTFIAPAPFTFLPVLLPCALGMPGYKLVSKQFGSIAGCTGEFTRVVRARTCTRKGPRSGDKASGTGFCLESQR